MTVTDHHRKYAEGTKNLLLRSLLNHFLAEVVFSIQAFQPRAVLDVGCGDGSALHYLASAIPPAYLGVDRDEEAIALCRTRYPQRQFQIGDIFALPFEDRSHDLVLCLEVLEHLEDPESALHELLRVADHGVVLSVPWEPWFRLGNLARGKHIRMWGNHPEHIQHWSPRSFGLFIRSIAPHTHVQLQGAWPWLIASIRL